MPPRKMKPVALMTKHLTKAEREAREKAEMELVGSRDRLEIPPDELNEDEKLIYTKLIDDLKHIKCLQNSDQLIFKVLAQTEYKMYLCEQEIKEYGMFVDKFDRVGNKERVANPAIKVQKDLAILLKSYFSEIGLSASSRIKLSEIKEEKENEDSLNEILGALRG